MIKTCTCRCRYILITPLICAIDRQAVPSYERYMRACVSIYSSDVCAFSSGAGVHVEPARESPYLTTLRSMSAHYYSHDCRENKTLFSSFLRSAFVY